MTEKNWSKSKFKKYIYSEIVKKLEANGFLKDDILCKKILNANIFSIDPMYAAGKIANEVSISFSCALYIEEWNKHFPVK